MTARKYNRLVVEQDGNETTVRGHWPRSKKGDRLFSSENREFAVGWATGYAKVAGCMVVDQTGGTQRTIPAPKQRVRL